MNRMRKFKEYIPITFAIFVTFIFIVLGILSIIGVFPFNKKHKDVGIGMIVFGVLCGFYIGICIGHLIVYILNRYFPEEKIEISLI
jgi:hypothetical protein